jgi:hypothetical protein
MVTGIDATRRTREQTFPIAMRGLPFQGAALFPSKMSFFGYGFFLH